MKVCAILVFALCISGTVLSQEAKPDSSQSTAESKPRQRGAIAAKQEQGTSQTASAGERDRENRATLRGVVRFSDGKPAVGAEVTLYNTDSEQVFTTKTDARGKYSFNKLFSGNYRLRAKLAEHAQGTTPNHAAPVTMSGAEGAIAASPVAAAVPYVEEETISISSREQATHDLVIKPGN